MSGQISGCRVAAVPLVVDLDETLVLTDTLYESAIALLRQAPWVVLLVPFWAMCGKSFLKAQIARRVALQPDTLPYREDLLAFLRAERNAGRMVVLATATHRSLAEAIANHLGLFDEVLASDENVNLKAGAKREGLRERFGSRGFDYIGDSRADLAGPNDRLMLLAEASGAVRGRSFGGGGRGVQRWLRAIRIHQWVKNLLIFVPIVLAHRVETHVLALLLVAFFAFSAITPLTYLSQTDPSVAFSPSQARCFMDGQKR